MTDEDDSMRVTDCECEEAGWCERHKCHKSEWLYANCRRNENSFALWEQGRGSGQRSRTFSPCQHLGQVVRFEECTGCRGQVRIKVFRCSLHEECVLAASIEKLQSCSCCKDYSAQTIGESQETS